MDLAHHEIFCAKAGRGGIRCFSRICFALSQLGFNIPPGFNIPLGFNIPVGSQVYRKIPVEIPLGFNIPAGSHRDLVSQWDPGGIPSGSRFYFHLGTYHFVEQQRLKSVCTYAPNGKNLCCLHLQSAQNKYSTAVSIGMGIY